MTASLAVFIPYALAGIVLIGCIVWAATARCPHRVRVLVISGLVLVGLPSVISFVTNIIAVRLFSPSTDSYMAYLVVSAVITSLMHSAGIALLVAAALTRRKPPERSAEIADTHPRHAEPIETGNPYQPSRS